MKPTTQRTTITDCCGKEVILDHTIFCLCSHSCGKTICNPTYRQCPGVARCVKCDDECLLAHLNEAQMCQICARHKAAKEFRTTDVGEALRAAVDILGKLRDAILADEICSKTSAADRLKLCFTELEHVENICKHARLRALRANQKE